MALSFPHHAVEWFSILAEKILIGDQIVLSAFVFISVISARDVIDTNGLFIAIDGSTDKNVNFNLSFLMEVDFPSRI